MQTDNQKPVYQYSPEVLKLWDVLSGGALLVLRGGGGGRFFLCGENIFLKKMGGKLKKIIWLAHWFK
jgi:hypothetical protein